MEGAQICALIRQTAEQGAREIRDPPQGVPPTPQAHSSSALNWGSRKRRFAQSRAPLAAQNPDPEANGIGQNRAHQNEEQAADGGVQTRIEKLGAGGGRVGRGPGAQSGIEASRLGQESEPRDRRKELLIAGGVIHYQQPEQRHTRYPDELGAMHLQENCGRHAEGDGGQELIGDSEKRPQRINAAKGIEHTLIQEVSP